MKKLKIAAALFAAMLSFQGFSQVKDSVNTPDMDKNHMEDGNMNKYCASMKDGKMVILFQDNIISEDVTLVDGTQLSPDGTIWEKKGSKTQLQDGQCVSKEGVIGTGMEEKKEPTGKKINNNKNKPKNKPAVATAKAKKNE